MAQIKERYRPIVGMAAKAAGAAGVPGAFFGPLDVGAVAGIWTAMTMAIADESKHKIDKAYAAKMVAAVGTGGAAYFGGSKLLTSALHFVFPGIGTVAAVGLNSFLNFWFTYRVGKALSGLFDSPDFSSLDLGELVLSVVAVLSPVPGPSELADAVDLAVNTPLVHPEIFKVFEQNR